MFSFIMCNNRCYEATNIVFINHSSISDDKNIPKFHIYVIIKTLSFIESIRDKQEVTGRNVRD